MPYIDLKNFLGERMPVKLDRPNILTILTLSVMAASSYAGAQLPVTPAISAALLLQRRRRQRPQKRQ